MSPHKNGPSKGQSTRAGSPGREIRRYVYFITFTWLGRTEFHPQRLAASLAEPGIFRVAVNNNKLERIASLKDFRPAGTFGAWLSLTPDDDPLVLRDVGPPEIYALSWEAP